MLPYFYDHTNLYVNAFKQNKKHSNGSGTFHVEFCRGVDNLNNFFNLKVCKWLQVVQVVKSDASDIVLRNVTVQSVLGILKVTRLVISDASGIV